ncbi:hypothetical protein B5S33_g2605 [[Candida] boidinii]|nr:hypothetical protein B5S33_g2605 [[Candida] boidinii]
MEEVKSKLTFNLNGSAHHLAKSNENGIDLVPHVSGQPGLQLNPHGVWRAVLGLAAAAAGLATAPAPHGGQAVHVHVHADPRGDVPAALENQVAHLLSNTGQCHDISYIIWNITVEFLV